MEQNCGKISEEGNKVTRPWQCLSEPGTEPPYLLRERGHPLATPLARLWAQGSFQMLPYLPPRSLLLLQGAPRHPVLLEEE